MALKILLCADGNSIHTIRWALALRQRGLEIGLFSLQPIHHDSFVNSGIEIEDGGIAQPRNRTTASFKKMVYLSALPRLRRTIRSFQPDLLHAHFASSYGLLGSLSGFQPLVLSVWGIDVFEFPQRNLMFRAILKFNLARARRILSTSQVMAEETKKYTNKPIMVTPFGVELEKFKPINGLQESESIIDCNLEVTFGTIKTLESKYGIDLLIKAFARLYQKHGVGRLIIAGEGSERENLERLCSELSISDRVEFIGRIMHEKVPELLNVFDVYVALSRFSSESFGVAIVEAQACGRAVVVSNVGGLPEVVEHKVTGFVVNNESVDAAAEAMERLMLDQGLRNRMGFNGRKRVEQLYDWNQNVTNMIEIYKEVLKD